ncbi:hypothetical protein BCR35DRAFT_356222 [Leucosporidium creatinivorum]|uniref:Uncharacterized protein n=1 Tax=Leucosporidium creatinivorum TaxID=106004 RepID=A0A1Y2CLI0_9BASI|nr:hypothetical protein BCR35DRAFT_356222 [Leucosporidium creatinivorum]
MPAPRHPTHAQYQQQDDAAPAFSKGKGAQHYQQPADGLAISYEQHSQPLYHADESERAMGWDRNDLPIPRNVTKGGFLAAYDPQTDSSNRVDSVFDAYADMYADMEGEEDDEQQQEEQGGVEYDSSAHHDAQPPLEDYNSQPQAREPWDQRGKNGLYGGGGRGADDRETGWVSNYGLGGRAAGVEEDLRYEEEQAGRTARLDSRDTYRGGRRRSSSGTEHSSYGPVTPTNDSFSGPAGGPHIANHESGYRHGNSPPSTQEIKPSSKLSFSHPPPMPDNTQPPTSPPTTLKKKTPPPKASGVPVPLVNPMQQADTSLLNTTRRKSAFKWNRSKKTPVISNPILPDGFVESLGMETFALTPGCSAPNHLLQQSAASSSANLGSDHDSSASSVKSGKKDQKDQNRAPRPRKISNRPNFLPALKLGAPDLNVPISHPDGTSSLPRPTESPIPTPVRLPLNALRHSSGDERNSSDYSHEISDAFRRLSRDSEVSYAPSSKTLASAEKTRRLYFNGIREERARQADQEVQANRAPILANAPAVPAMPTRYQDEVESPAPSQSTTRHGSTDSAFRNPWGPNSGARQSGGSFHSNNGAGNRRSFGTPQGFNTEPRGSISSHRTINQQPYRPKSFTRPKSHTAPVIEASDSRESSNYGGGEEERQRQGSTSSAYSENSNINDYLSSSSDNEDIYSSYTSQPQQPLHNTQPLRRKSLAPTATAPLNLNRRQPQEEKVVPSAQGTTGPSGGFNNWGHREEAGSAPFGGFGARADPDIIGATGFRNPFG